MKALQDIVLLVATAALMTPLSATAQEALPTSTSTQQTLSMGQPSQNYDVLHVNVVTGSDQQGAGSAEQPYKTITQALRMAPTTSTVILLAPGHYSQETGEQFPLRLRPGITIQGISGETRNTLIVGGGEVQVGNVTQNAAIVTADRSGLANILVSNAKGSGVWITAGSPILRRVALVSNAVAGVQVTNGAPIVENSYFHDNQYGLTLQGTGHALVRGNYFEATGHAITVASPATPTIHNNRIALNRVGIALKNNARPRLDANVLNDNGRNGVVEVEATTALAPALAPSLAPVLAPRSDGELAVLTQPSARANPGTDPGTNARETGGEAGRETGAIAVKLPVAHPAAAADPIAITDPETDIGTETAADTSGVAAAPTPRSEIGDETAVSAIAPPREDLSREDLSREDLPREDLALRSSPSISAAPAPITAAEQLSPDSPVMQVPATPPPTLDRRQATLPEPAGVAVNPTVEAVAAATVTNALEHVAAEPVEHATVDPLEHVAADDAITIAVIPASGSEIAHNNPVNHDTPAATHGRREGVSKLLARLNSSLVREPAPAEDNDSIGLAPGSAPGLTTPDVPAVPATAASGQRLPVPSARIPSSGGSLTLSPPGTLALAATFRYRVLVDMADAEDLTQLVPDAFRTSVGSRMVMQAGAYIDEVEAQERLEWLRENGIEGRVDVRN